MTVKVSNEQDDVAIDVAGLERLGGFVLAAESADEEAELSIGIVDEARMTQLNETYAGRPGSTDVLAFAFDESEDETELEAEEPLLLGDVVLCPAVAARNAAQFETDVARELQLLLVHGTLHLLGYDHDDAGADEAMRARQADLIQRFSTGGSP